MRTRLRAPCLLAFAALAAACSPDPSSFPCTSSAECPSGYHCDVARASAGVAHCAAGAPADAPALLAFAWDSTSMAPGGTATLTFTTSVPIASASVTPETSIHNLAVGALTPLAAGPNTYALRFTAPAACDGAGANPLDGAPIAIALTFADAGHHAGSGAVGSVSCDVAKTMAVSSGQVRVSTQPWDDGSVRVVVSAQPGAVSAPQGLLGVSLVARSGSTLLGASPANADGSALAFEIPAGSGAPTLSFEDRRGTRAQVAGYVRRFEMNAAGKPVAGNRNPSAAFDVGTQSASRYAPAGWIAQGPGPSGAASEYALSGAADGGVVLDAYSGIAALDGVAAASVAPAQLDLDAGVWGWEPVAVAGTLANPQREPAARSGAALGPSILPGSYSPKDLTYSLAMFGGQDASGSPVDPPGTVWGLDPVYGWEPLAPVVSATGNPAYPASQIGGLSTPPTVFSGVALAPGFTSSCTSPCVRHQTYLAVMGGLSPSGLSNKVYALADWFDTSTGNLKKYSGWFDTGLSLPVANANAGAAYVDTGWYPNAGATDATYGPSELLLGGDGVTGDANVCTFLALFSRQLSAEQYRAYDCTTPEFAHDPGSGTTGAIGNRNGMAVAWDGFTGNPTVVYAFGGARVRATTPALDAATNDLWKGTFTVRCMSGNTDLGAPPCPAATTARFTPSWTQVTTTTPPPPRAFAQLQVLGGRLVLSGGIDANGVPLADLWDLDLSLATPKWTQKTLDAAPALQPGPIAGLQSAVATDGAGRGIFVPGGSPGAPSRLVWEASLQGRARTLFRASTGAPGLDPSRVTALHLELEQANGAPAQARTSLWDGSLWRLVDASATGIVSSIDVANPGNYLQPDGNVYVLIESSASATPTSAGASARIDHLSVRLDAR